MEACRARAVQCGVADLLIPLEALYAELVGKRERRCAAAHWRPHEELGRARAQREQRPGWVPRRCLDMIQLPHERADVGAGQPKRRQMCRCVHVRMRACADGRRIRAHAQRTCRRIECIISVSPSHTHSARGMLSLRVAR